MGLEGDVIELESHFLERGTESRRRSWMSLGGEISIVIFLLYKQVQIV